MNGTEFFVSWAITIYQIIDIWIWDLGMLKEEEDF